MRLISYVTVVLASCQHYSGYIIPEKNLHYTQIPDFENTQNEEKSFADISATDFQDHMAPGGDLPYLEVPIYKTEPKEDDHTDVPVTICNGNITAVETDDVSRTCKTQDDTICVRKDTAAAVGLGSLALLLLMLALQRHLGQVAGLPSFSPTCSPSCQLSCCDGTCCCDCLWLMARSLLRLCCPRTATNSCRHKPQDTTSKKSKQQKPITKQKHCAVDDKLFEDVLVENLNTRTVSDDGKPLKDSKQPNSKEFYVLQNSLSYFVVCPVHR